MLRNNVTEEYLKGFVPGLEYLLWTDETNYDKQKEKASQIVFNDLQLKGFRPYELSPELSLRSSASIDATETLTGLQDSMNRFRLVLQNISQTTSGKALTFQGSNDNSTWTTIETIELTPLSVIEYTLLFYQSYKYYRLVTTVLSGTIDYTAFLTETKYDLLFAYKWLEIILRDAKTTADDQFAIKEIDFRRDYNDLLNSGKYELDTNNDGVPDVQTLANTLDILR